MRLGTYGRAVRLLSVTLMFSAWVPLPSKLSLFLREFISKYQTRVQSRALGGVPLPATLLLLMLLSWSLEIFWFCVVSDTTNVFLCMSTFSKRPYHSAFSQGFVISGHEVPAAAWFWRFLDWPRKEFWRANGCQIGPKFDLVSCLSHLLNVGGVLWLYSPQLGKQGFPWQVCQIASKRPVCTCLILQPLPPELTFKETLNGPSWALAILWQLLGGLKPC